MSNNDVKGGFAFEGDGTDEKTRARARAERHVGQAHSVCAEGETMVTHNHGVAI